MGEAIQELKRLAEAARNVAPDVAYVRNQETGDLFEVRVSNFPPADIEVRKMAYAEDVIAEAAYSFSRSADTIPTLIEALSAAEARAEAAEAKLAEALLNPDPWRPIEELGPELKDGRKVLFWSKSGPIVGVWDRLEGDWRATIRVLTKCYVIDAPTHFRELKGPGQ